MNKCARRRCTMLTCARPQCVATTERHERRAAALTTVRCLPDQSRRRSFFSWTFDTRFLHTLISFVADPIRATHVRTTGGASGAWRPTRHNMQGSPKNWHTFLYALTSSNIDRFSNLFHYLDQEIICNNMSLKIPPHFKCAATLPCEINQSINQNTFL